MLPALGIDLAERHSAAVLLDAAGSVSGVVTADFGKAEKPPRPQRHHEPIRQFARHLAKLLESANLGDKSLCPACVRIGVEDVHPFAINPKPALRVQGAFLLAMDDLGFLECRLVSVSEWQRHHGYKKEKGRTSKGWAKERVAELGYDTSEYVGKAAVDVRDAVLIARFLQDTCTGDA